MCLLARAGYVEQFDTLVDELTVTEMLMYTAELKRSRHEPLAVRSWHMPSLDPCTFWLSTTAIGLRPS